MNKILSDKALIQCRKLIQDLMTIEKEYLNDNEKTILIKYYNNLNRNNVQNILKEVEVLKAKLVVRNKTRIFSCNKCTFLKCIVIGLYTFIVIVSTLGYFVGLSDKTISRLWFVLLGIIRIFMFLKWIGIGLCIFGFIVCILGYLSTLRGYAYSDKIIFIGGWCILLGVTIFIGFGDR